MKSLTEKLQKALSFDDDRCNHPDLVDFNYMIWRNGLIQENDRLKPYYDALIECVEALIQYEDTAVCLDDGDNFVAASALTKLRELVGNSEPKDSE